MRIHVEILTGHSSPWSSDFGSKDVTIGRVETANVRLHPTKDTSCSRGIHARLVRIDGQWKVRAEHESGVTVLDSRERVTRRLSKGEEHAFDHDVSFELGDGGPRLAATVVGAELPVTDRRRHGGAAALPVGRVSGDVLAKARRAPKLIAAVAVLVIIVGGVAWFLNSQTAKSVEDTKATLAGVEDSVGAFESRVGATEDAIALAAERIRTGEQRVATAEERAAENEARLTRLEQASSELVAALRKAEQSVYIVGTNDAAGEFRGIGTAWAVGPRLLATNAHVWEGLQSTVAHSSSLKMIARRPGAPPVDIEITTGESHPGYSRWNGSARAARFVDQRAVVVSYVPICDVAVMRTAADVAAPLALANLSELQLNSVGDSIGYVGFPMEGVIGAFVNPEPLQDIGQITGLTDRFAEHTTFDRQLVIRFDMKITGGASGSPILSADGRVIGLVNAGSLTRPVPGLRIPLGFNFGQRVDLLRELLDGSASTNQAARDQEWVDQLRDLNLSPEAVIWSFVNDQYEKMKDALALGSNDQIQIDRIGSWRVATTDVSKFRDVRGYRLQPGIYLFAASSSGWTDTDFHLAETFSSSRKGFTFQPFGPNRMVRNAVTVWSNLCDAYAMIEVTDAIDVDLTLIAKTYSIQGEETFLQAYRLTAPSP